MITFVFGLVVGVAVSLFVERPLGALLDRRKHERIEAARRRAFAALRGRADLAGRLIDVGSDELFVAEFDPSGLDHERISTRWRSRSEDLEALLDALPDGARPGSTAELLAAVGERAAALERDPIAWNGERPALRAVSTRRTPDREEPVVELTFEPSDFAAFEVLTGRVRERLDRLRPVIAADDDALRTVLPGLSHSFGMNATVQTADGKLLLTRRSYRAYGSQQRRHISVNEGTSLADVRSDGTVDLVGCLMRGSVEELGVAVPRSSVMLHTVLLLLSQYQWGMLGHIDLTGTSIDSGTFLEVRALGLAQDDWEAAELFLVDYEIETVLDLLADDTDWVGHGWLNLALSAIHTWPSHAARVVAAMRSAGAAAPTD